MTSMVYFLGGTFQNEWIQILVLELQVKLKKGVCLYLGAPGADSGAWESQNSVPQFFFCCFNLALPSLSASGCLRMEVDRS